MRLHLSAEDVGLYLQDHAARAQQRIPAAAKELLRIQVWRGWFGLWPQFDWCHVCSWLDSCQLIGLLFGKPLNDGLCR